MNQKALLKIFPQQKVRDLGELFGIFFEDLNHAADGGLYAELVQNRSFEFDPVDNKDYHHLTAWEKVELGNAKVTLSVEDAQPLNENNKHYASINVMEPGDGAGIMNLGYNTGIPLEQGENYLFSCYARSDSDADKTLTITLESIDGCIYALKEIVVTSKSWKKYHAVVKASETDFSARLVLTTKEHGKLDLDMVSLFPEHTYKNRPNGMRKDIAQYLEELKPKFMRFPGGCLIHDGSLNSEDRDSMYRWKNTIGNIEQRPARRNNWKYNQSLGLGYYEYFQFCEDIKAKPIPILPAGYDPHHGRIVPIDELEPWINDALDLIEFANGDSSTEWGRIRAELGHPEPFGLEYLGIGNEEVGKPFFERYEYFHKAIKEKYPHIKIINSSGPFAAGSEYNRGWESARKNNSDLVDEHYYQSPEWFIANYHRYDDFEENGPKVFLGEYASWGNTYYNALVEAAYMTGLEKNPAVGLACYAPLLCNSEYVNWQPNLIWFNNHQVYGTANYYVQKLFMNHQGDDTIKAELAGADHSLSIKEKPIIGDILIGDERSAANYWDIKIINMDTGEEKHFEKYFIENGHPVELGYISWTNYCMSFKSKKTNGERGFKVYFGKIDEKNCFVWDVGGWQNQDAIIGSSVNGRNSCLVQSLFSVENEIEYQLELQVNGRHIRGYIDGTLVNETEDKLPIIAPLYYSSSSEKSTGDVIVKVINLQETLVDAEILLEGIKNEGCIADVYVMSGHELSQKNSFKSPDLIAPEHCTISVSGNSLDYTFPQHSITIFRFHGLLSTKIE